MTNEIEKNQIKQSIREIIKLRCKFQKKTPMEVVREIKEELRLLKEKK